MSRENIKWKIFYYIPFKNFIFYYSPTLHRLGIFFKDSRVTINNNIILLSRLWNNLIDKLVLFIVKCDIFITYFDHHLRNFRREIVNIILYYTSLPFYYIGYMAYNDMYYDFYYVIQFYHKIKHYIFIICYIICYVYIIYNLALMYYNFATDALILGSREKILFVESIKHVDHSMIENFPRLSFMKTLGYGLYAAQLCMLFLTWVDRFITDCVIMPWPVMFFSMWSYTDQIIEPEREMRRNKVYQRIRMIIGFLLESS